MNAIFFTVTPQPESSTEVCTLTTALLNAIKRFADLTHYVRLSTPLPPGVSAGEFDSDSSQ